MKYKKHLATGALAISLLLGGYPVYSDAATLHKPYKYSQIVLKKQHTTVGVVSLIDNAGFTLDVKNLKTKQMISIDVKTDSSTMYNKNGLATTVSDLLVGQKVIVTGDYNKVSNIITAKKVKIVSIVTSKLPYKQNGDGRSGWKWHSGT